MGTRFLEIGPGYHGERIDGFETVDFHVRDNVDHVADASAVLPFDNNTFDIVYASHVLEHIEWVKTEDTLKEWVRILKPKGWLEIWVPDALKICKRFVIAEANRTNINDEEKDPCKKANGRIFSFGGWQYLPTGNHKALFSRRYLKKLMEKAGLINLTDLKKEDIRGVTDYGWINLGVKGVKI